MRELSFSRAWDQVNLRPFFMPGMLERVFKVTNCDLKERRERLEVTICDLKID